MSAPVKLLLVDDEAAFVKALSEHLTLCGYSVAVAFDGDQALAQIEKEPPALAFLDLKLPGPNGEELVRRIREISPQTKMIILTAYRDEGAREASLRQAGVSGYLYKPISSLLELERLIEATLKGNSS